MSKKNDAKNAAPKSNAPMLIIGLVAIAALVVAYYWFVVAKPAPRTTANTAANSAAANRPKAASIPPNAPPGANPPNQTGSPTATVTLEEYADFQCGSCAVAHPVMNEIKSAYGQRIKFVFRNFPLAISGHDKAYDAAVAVEAAGLQGKFWDLQNLLFQNQQTWNTSGTYKQLWKEYAGKIGLNIEKWESDMAGLAAKGRVDADIARGRAIGVNATPTLFINGNAVPPGDMTTAGIRAIIDAELAKSSPAASNENANAAAPANAAK